MDDRDSVSPADDPKSHQRILLEFLADRDVECPNCKYNLRSLTSRRCPECGEEMKLSVGLVEPKQAAFIAGIVGLSAGVGLCGLLLVYGLIVILVIGRQGLDFSPFFPENGIGLVIHLFLLSIWMRAWKRVRRMSTGTRRRLAFLCWVPPMAFIVLFAFTIK
jgi:hypothetical protein